MVNRLEAHMPNIVVLENVESIDATPSSQDTDSDHEGGEAKVSNLDSVIKELHNKGYAARAVLVDSRKDCQVPQKRRPFYFVALRNDGPWKSGATAADMIDDMCDRIAHVDKEPVALTDVIYTAEHPTVKLCLQHKVQKRKKLDEKPKAQGTTKGVC